MKGVVKWPANALDRQVKPHSQTAMMSGIIRNIRYRLKGFFRTALALPEQERRGTRIREISTPVVSRIPAQPLQNFILSESVGAATISS